MSWPGTDFELEIQNELDRYKTALEHIVEIGEDPTTTVGDAFRAFKIADEALNPEEEEVVNETG